ncbi:MAG: hypothetical protein J6I76_11550 [Oribacterium sp.]|nr:hypothetical protein [Oribacterium sp.]MBP3804511.1 hypothetical protein [Oribacterium sp.]
MEQLTGLGKAIVAADPDKNKRRKYMNILEATIAMLESMPDEDISKVYKYTRKLFEEIKPENPFGPLTKEQVLTDLAISREEFEQGKSLDAREAIMEMRRSHGFI